MNWASFSVPRRIPATWLKPAEAPGEILPNGRFLPTIRAEFRRVCPFRIGRPARHLWEERIFRSPSGDAGRAKGLQRLARLLHQSSRQQEKEAVMEYEQQGYAFPEYDFDSDDFDNLDDPDFTIDLEFDDYQDLSLSDLTR